MEQVLGKSLGEFVSLKVADVFQDLKTKASGLSETEARARNIRYGKNVFIEEKKTPLIFQFLKAFKNPLVLILLFAATTSFLLGQAVNAIIIYAIVLLSATLNFFQEYSANRAVEKLTEKVAVLACVIRDGIKKEIKIAHVSIGDIVFLQAGDLVPADARVIDAKDFFVSESSITGESYPIEKFADQVLKKTTSLNEMSNIIFSGSSVITGEATVVVVKTGTNTEIGQIGKKLTLHPIDSEFSKGIKNFSYMILKITIFFVLFIFFCNALLKHDIFQSFLFAVAVAVGLTPELLPVIMSITMSKGSLKMAKKGVIVKKLTAIPNFGSMDVLCTDKTGTLTEDDIQVVKYIDITGKESQSVLLFGYINSFYQTGIKNPLDSAILRFKHEAIAAYKKIDEVPFDFKRRKMSVIVAHGTKHIMVCKGATEEIFSSCNFVEENNHTRKFEGAEKAKATKLYEDLSRQGYRVIALASKEVTTQKKVYEKEDEKNLTFLGLIAFMDPAKKDVKEVLSRLESMGISIKVITGDNELVAKKILSDVGLTIKGILLGKDLASLTDDALRVRVEKVTLFARFSPDQKNRIINALKANGHVVGFLGDGINDAPSLRNADVGISVNNAIDVAKESADIILTHKSLKELEEGVIEGRKTFGNTIKYILMGLSSNFGNMFSVLVAVLFLPFLPMLPIQILLNNFLYDISQITIPSDSIDSEFIQKPRQWDLGFIKKFMFVFGLVSSIFDMMTFFLLYRILHVSPALFQTGWFLESLATQVFVIYIIRTEKIPFLQSRPSLYLVLSTVSCVLIGWLLPYTIVGRYFGFSAVSMQLLLLLVGITVLYLVVVEIIKQTFFSKEYSL